MAAEFHKGPDGICSLKAVLCVQEINCTEDVLGILALRIQHMIALLDSRQRTTEEREN